MSGSDNENLNIPESVKAGENHEREKLDSEHESDGMKKAMDSCGLDSENAEFQKAFAEGVKYGERLEKDEPKKLDSEHESKGAMDSATLFAELAARNALAEKLSWHIGTFAFDSLDHQGVAKYGAKKLKLKHSGNAVDVVNAYLANRSRPADKVAAMDSAPTSNQIKEFYGLE